MASGLAESYEVRDLERALEAAGVRFSNEPSNVQGSPYRYLFVYLTERGVEGPHLILSDLREWESEDGIIVGRWDDYEDQDPDQETVASIGAAVEYAVRRSGGR